MSCVNKQYSAIQLRRGLNAEFEASNIILASGEPAFATDTKIFKIGDGVTPWSTLVSPTSSGQYLIGVSGDNLFVDTLQFNTTTAADLIQGQLGWNDTFGTLDIGITDTYAMHVGEETHFRVRNETNDTILKGEAVWATGIHNDNIRLEIDKFASESAVSELRFIGLATETLNKNNSGYTTNFGYIKGTAEDPLDTRGDAATYGTTDKIWATGEPAWNIGDILYIHPTVSGKLTKIEPKHSISVAIILDIDTNQGEQGLILVRPTSYGHLNDNHDVNTTGVNNNDYLIYDSTQELWLPTNSGIFENATISNTLTVDQIYNETGDFQLYSVAQDSELRIDGNTGTAIIIGNAQNDVTIDSNTTHLYGSIDVKGNLLSPTAVFDIGTVSSGNVFINYGHAKQIQTCTVNGPINIVLGSDWPLGSSPNWPRSADVLLIMTVTTNTVITFDIVDEWYNRPDSFTTGKYLILFRSIGDGTTFTIQGHYIGEET